jgi:uncharacterized membrane protein
MIVFCRDDHEHCCWCYFVDVGIDFGIAMLLFVSFSVALLFFVVMLGRIVVCCKKGKQAG